MIYKTILSGWFRNGPGPLGMGASQAALAPRSPEAPLRRSSMAKVTFLLVNQRFREVTTIDVTETKQGFCLQLPESRFVLLHALPKAYFSHEHLIKKLRNGKLCIAGPGDLVIWIDARGLQLPNL